MIEFSQTSESPPKIHHHVLVWNSYSTCSYQYERMHAGCLQRRGESDFPCFLFLYLLHHNTGKKSWISQLATTSRSQGDFRAFREKAHNAFSNLSVLISLMSTAVEETQGVLRKARAYPSAVSESSKRMVALSSVASHLSS